MYRAGLGLSVSRPTDLDLWDRDAVDNVHDAVVDVVARQHGGVVDGQLTNRRANRTHASVETENVVATEGLRGADGAVVTCTVEHANAWDDRVATNHLLDSLLVDDGRVQREAAAERRHVRVWRHDDRVLANGRCAIKAEFRHQRSAGDWIDGVRASRAQTLQQLLLEANEGAGVWVSQRRRAVEDCVDRGALRHLGDLERRGASESSAAHGDRSGHGDHASDKFHD